MKDKNGNEIKVGMKCVVDDTFLGVVTGLLLSEAVVLMLKEEHCYEEAVEPDRIEVKN